MGRGPEKEYLLILLYQEPTSLVDSLRAKHPNLTVHYHRLESEFTTTAPADLFKPATVLFTLFALPPSLAAAPNLRYVHFFSAGINASVYHPIYTDTDIPLTTSSGVAAPTIAEWCLLTALAQSRRYNFLYERQRDHTWVASGPQRDALFGVRDSVGQRVGILGYGAIGRQVGRLAHGLGMTVVAYTARPRNTPEQRRDTGYVVAGTGDAAGKLPAEWHGGTDKESLHRFLGADLDWLVVAVPLTDATTGLLGAEEFRVLGRSRRAFFSNISRGPIVRQDDLVEALRPADGGAPLLRGAALDGE